MYGYPIGAEIELTYQGVVYTYYADIIIVDPLRKNTHSNILGQTVWSRWGLHLNPSLFEIDPLKPDLKTPP